MSQKAEKYFFYHRTIVCESVGMHHTCLFIIMNNSPCLQYRHYFVLSIIDRKICHPRVAPGEKQINAMRDFFYLHSIRWRINASKFHVSTRFLLRDEKGVDRSRVHACLHF